MNPLVSETSVSILLDSVLVLTGVEGSKRKALVRDAYAILLVNTAYSS